MPRGLEYPDYRVPSPDDMWRVYISSVPPEGGFLSRLFLLGPRGAVIRALRIALGLDTFEAGWLLGEIPRDVDVFMTEEAARVVAEALTEAGAVCEVRPPRSHAAAQSDRGEAGV